MARFPADETHDGGDVDDGATARPLHGRNSVFGAQEDACGINLHNAVPALGIHGINC